ncbi:Wzz/FepE/Etk N-terminal domain-containing protein [Fusobacteria bacterium ZRK30]|nr:Wzz/FepE/Etk N-terminal domain-containing protein [Fusobacteria bacterium ZRK30]
MKRKKREEDLRYEWEEEDDDEIELMDLVFILIRSWKLIVMSALPVIVLGTIFAMTRPDIYQAEATLMVSSGQIYSINNLDNAEISKNQKLVSSYTEIAKSKSIMKNVIRKLDLDMEPDEIAKLLKVTSVNDTEFIKLSYTDKNAQRAALLTNEVAGEFILKIKKVMSFENLKIVEKASIPDKALPKKRTLILAVSMVLGVMIGVFVAFMMEFLHSKLRKPEDIEKIMGCSVLANIPDFNIEKAGEK